MSYNLTAEDKKAIAEYDVKEFDRPSVTSDIVVFTIKDDDLKILLVKRDLPPFKGMWSLPGGFVGIDEPLEAAARRDLEKKTSVKDIYLEQLCTFGEPNRDPRTRVITVNYFGLVAADSITLKKPERNLEVEWHSAYHLPKMAFDHKEIIEYALQRLRYKLDYTNAAGRLLPKKFTLTELQRVYEIILDEKQDKRNFRKLIKRLDLLEETNETKMEGAHRPAKLYRLKERKVYITRK